MEKWLDLMSIFSEEKKADIKNNELGPHFIK